MIIILVTGCASISNNHNLFVINSSHPTQVYGQDKKVLGKTPFYTNIDTSRKQFLYTINNQGNYVAHPVRCPIDWTGSIIPNSIFSLLGGPGFIITGSFLGIDAYNGDIFKCKDNIDINIGNDHKKIENNLPTVLLLPFVNQDSLVSKKVEDSVRKILQKQNSLQLIPLETTNDILTQEDIHHSTSVEHESESVFKKKIINSLFKSNANTFAQINTLSYERSTLTVQIVFKNGFTFENHSKLSPITIKLKNIQMKEEIFDVKKQFQKIFNFLPNSISLSYGPTVKAHLNSENDQTTKRHPDSLPAIFSLFGVENVQNPRHYSNWDYSFYTFPSIGISSWAKDIERNPSNYSYQVTSYYTFYNMALTGHSPIGALALELGYGIGFYQLKNSIAFDENFWRSKIKIGINYTFFFNKKFYGRIGINQYSINGEITDGITTQKGWLQSYLGIGYYYPNLRYLIKRLF